LCDALTHLSTTLLNWYDDHARVLPWRMPPAASRVGVFPDPYHVWLSEIMLQQTTVTAVIPYYSRFLTLWPDLLKLAAADDDRVMAAWAGLGYYARARNLLACARSVRDQYGGVFPRSNHELRALPGIGPYTAAAIGAIAFGQPETVGDGNVERVMARLYDVETPLPAAKKVLTDLAGALTPQSRAGDYAQAVMDLGSTVCTPRNPNCGHCPWRVHCAGFAQGTQNELPHRESQKQRPHRHGFAYVARRGDGALLLETRPKNGLLGGMLGWPGSSWDDSPEFNPPFSADWMARPGSVRHIFTHFSVEIAVYTATVPQDFKTQTGAFTKEQDFDITALPSLMRKIHAHATAR